MLQVVGQYQAAGEQQAPGQGAVLRGWRASTHSALRANTVVLLLGLRYLILQRSLGSQPCPLYHTCGSAKTTPYPLCLGKDRQLARRGAFLQTCAPSAQMHQEGAWLRYQQRYMVSVEMLVQDSPCAGTIRQGSWKCCPCSENCIS